MWENNHTWTRISGIISVVPLNVFLTINKSYEATKLSLTVPVSSPSRTFKNHITTINSDWIYPSVVTSSLAALRGKPLEDLSPYLDVFSTNNYYSINNLKCFAPQKSRRCSRKKWEPLIVWSCLWWSLQVRLTLTSVVNTEDSRVFLTYPIHIFENGGLRSGCQWIP